MKIFRTLVQTNEEPLKSSLWIKDGKIFYYNNGFWAPFGGDNAELIDTLNYLENGLVEMPEATIEEIEAGNAKTLVTKEYLETHSSDVVAKDVYRIESISTPNTSFFVENQENYTATFSVKVFKNEIDITDTLASNVFVWNRVSEDSTGDTTWNTTHLNIGSILNVTYTDLSGDTNFTCKVLDI